MPICVHCSFPTTQLINTYGKDHIILNQCTNCKEFCDPYLEQDGIIIFIDLVLHKSSVYRHLIFNNLDYCEIGFQSVILRLGLLITIFNVYLKWYQIELYCLNNNCNILEGFNHFWLYCLILSFSIIEYLTYILSIVVAVYFLIPTNIKLFKYNYVIITIIISSFSKLLLIAIVIWNYHQIEFSWLLTLLSWTSNFVALKTFLQFNNIKVLLIIIIGLIGKYFINWYIINYVLGLNELTV
ncbi:hypothetical protein CONCODRAFT_62082, partial [Conidiobolus coronatus NRRL 28638]